MKIKKLIDKFLMFLAVLGVLTVLIGFGYSGRIGPWREFQPVIIGAGIILIVPFIVRLIFIK